MKRLPPPPWFTVWSVPFQRPALSEMRAGAFVTFLTAAASVFLSAMGALSARAVPCLVVAVLVSSAFQACDVRVATGRRAAALLVGTIVAAVLVTLGVVWLAARLGQP